MFARKKIGLALSGGGARGLSHIGVLKVLEKYNIPIDFISGTSMGAIVGALYSLEPNAKQLEKIALETDWKHVFDYTFPSKGLIKGDRIEKFLREKLSSANFKDLKIPLFVTSFDLENNQEVIFTKGDVTKAIRASMAIPGVFVPVENDGKILVDGGLVDPIPTEILKENGCDIIISSVPGILKRKEPLLNQEAILKKSNKKLPHIIHILNKSLDFISSEISSLDTYKDKADVLIIPPLDDVGILDFSRVQEMIDIGEKEANKSIEEIRVMSSHNIFARFLNNLNNISIKDVVKKVNNPTE